MRAARARSGEAGAIAERPRHLKRRHAVLDARIQDRRRSNDHIGRGQRDREWSRRCRAWIRSRRRRGCWSRGRLRGRLCADAGTGRQRSRLRRHGGRCRRHECRRADSVAVGRGLFGIERADGCGERHHDAAKRLTGWTLDLRGNRRMVGRRTAANARSERQRERFVRGGRRGRGRGLRRRLITAGGHGERERDGELPHDGMSSDPGISVLRTTIYGHQPARTSAGVRERWCSSISERVPFCHTSECCVRGNGGFVSFFAKLKRLKPLSIDERPAC